MLEFYEVIILENSKILDILQQDYKALRDQYAEDPNPPQTDADFERIRRMLDLKTLLEFEQANLPTEQPSHDTQKFDLMAAAADELQGAKTYYAQYQETGDNRFLSMAKAELGHAAYIKQLLNEKGRTQEANQIFQKLQQLERQIR